MRFPRRFLISKLLEIMKNFAPFLIGLLFYSSAFSQPACSDLNVTKFDTAYFKLKGNVKTLSSTTMLTSDFQRQKMNQWLYKEHLEFNAEGNLIKREVNYPNTSKDIWHLTDAGQVEMHMHQDSTGKMDTLHIYEYENGAIFKVTGGVEENGLKYVWNFEPRADGRPQRYKKVQTSYHHERTVEDCRFKYDANGTLIRKKHTYTDAGKQTIEDISFTFDANGRKEKVVWMNEVGKRFLTEVFMYNPEGWIMKKMVTTYTADQSRKVTKTESRKYEYDATGNWTQRISRGVRRVDATHHTINREITYH